MTTPINLNEYVLVRLTDKGRRILELDAAAMQAIMPVSDWRPREPDADGFTRWQLWELMKMFGAHISMGGEVPFETTIYWEGPGV